MRFQDMADGLNLTPLQLMHRCAQHNLILEDIYPSIEDDYIELLRDEGTHIASPLNMAISTVRNAVNRDLSEDAYKLLDKLHRQFYYGKKVAVLDKFQNIVPQVRDAAKELEEKGFAELTPDKGAINLINAQKTEIEAYLDI